MIKKSNNATELYLYITTAEECTREIDPTDDWDAGDYHCSLSGLQVYLSKPPYYTDQFTAKFKVKAGDEVVVLFEQYGQGSTFGKTTGCLSAKGVYRTAVTALEASESMETNSDFFGGHEAWVTELVTVS